MGEFQLHKAIKYVDAMAVTCDGRCLIVVDNTPKPSLHVIDLSSVRSWLYKIIVNAASGKIIELHRLQKCFVSLIVGILNAIVIEVDRYYSVHCSVNVKIY